MTIESQIKRLSKLKQYNNFSEEELRKIAEEKELSEELKTEFVGLNEEEQKEAIKLYDKYIQENSFESLAEKSTLINVIYLEILNDRIKRFIEKESNEKDGAIPLRMTEQLVGNTSQIMELKEKLGMMKGIEEDSALSLFDELREKALAYYQENAGCNIVKCPECQNLFMLLMDIRGLEATKCTFFKGTLLYNQKIMELYHCKKITKTEVAEILGVHENYVNFIYTGIFLKKNDSQD